MTEIVDELAQRREKHAGAATKSPPETIPAPEERSADQPAEQGADPRACGVVSMAMEEANSRGLTTAQLAEKLGISLGYLFALRNGSRDRDKVGREVIDAFSRFLGISPISVMWSFGAIRPSDLLPPDWGQTKERELRRAIKFIREDEGWIGVLPDRPLEEDVQICIIRAYEKATGRILINQLSLIKQLSP